jgi:F-box associated protein
MPSSISNLPPELLDEIFDLLVGDSDSPPTTLPNCLLTCGTWYHHVRPLLYRDVVLDNDQLATFVRRMDFSADSYVRTLTISLEIIPPDVDEQMDYVTVRNGTRAAHRLWGHLEQLILSLQNMKNLYSFSIVVPHNEAAFGFWVPRSIIAKLVDQLPPTCINLEIDLKTLDHERPGAQHLCASIHRLLPQLKYLRLRLPSICPEICGNGTTKAYKMDQWLIRVDLTVRGAHAKICDTFEESSYYLYPDGTRTRHVMSACLRRLWETSCVPNIKMFYLIETQPGGKEGSPVFAAYIRRDIRFNISEALPYRQIAKGNENWLIRTEAEDYVCNRYVHETIVEEKSWAESINGIRLPSFIITSKGYVPRLLHLISSEAFQEKFKVDCLLLKHEKVHGVKLLEVKKIDGLTGEVRMIVRNPRVYPYPLAG